MKKLFIKLAKWLGFCLTLEEKKALEEVARHEQEISDYIHNE